MYPKTVAQSIASSLEAMRNCERTGNVEWLAKHRVHVLELVKEHMPSGSGIDRGMQIDLDKSSEDKLVFTFGFHDMDVNGYYNGWTEHVLTVKPSFSGLNTKISGPNRNDIKDYLHEIFDRALCATLQGDTVAAKEEL